MLPWRPPIKRMYLLPAHRGPAAGDLRAFLSIHSIPWVAMAGASRKCLCSVLLDRPSNLFLRASLGFPEKDGHSRSRLSLTLHSTHTGLTQATHVLLPLRQPQKCHARSSTLGRIRLDRVTFSRPKRCTFFQTRNPWLGKITSRAKTKGSCPSGAD